MFPSLFQLVEAVINVFVLTHPIQKSFMLLEVATGLPVLFNSRLDITTTTMSTEMPLTIW